MHTSGTRGLLAWNWKASLHPQQHLSPTTRTLDVSIALRRTHSSIAEAMLGRAVSHHEAFSTPPPVPPPTSKQNLAPPQSKNGNIQQQFQQVNRQQPSSKSIGGFTGFKNTRQPGQDPLGVKSANTPYMKEMKRTISRGDFPSTASSGSSTSSGLRSVFSREDSFANTPDTVVDLTQDFAKKREMLSSQGIVFDENDFDDDADIDLDDEYALPTTKKEMSAPPKSSLRTKSQSGLPFFEQPSSPFAAKKQPASSAQTWSSSPPANKATPPGAVERRRRAEEAQQAELDSSQPVKPPPKRRTLPWAQKKAEEQERLAKLEEEEENASSASPVEKCLRCGNDGHYAADCPSKGKGKSAYSFTPLPKDKNMPWNTTASAMANEKKQFRDKMKRKAEPNVEEAAVRPVKKVAMAPITLSEEQQRVLDLVVNQGKSVFFTGSAGTGKSVLMRAIIAELRKKFIRETDRVAVTASTGLAACNIGGVTLHSFGGIGLGKEDVPTLVKKIKKNAKAKTRWLKTKILVIDEISMVDGDLFDKLEGIARMIRNNGRPFGGIQLVITGDFFQLPPVPDYDKKAKDVKFAFDAGTWSTAVHHTIGLTEVFRQKDPGETPDIAEHYER